jgi:cell division protein FtsB
MPDLTEEEKEDVPPNVLAFWEEIRTKMDDPEADASQDPAAMLDWLYQRRSNLLREIEIAEADIATYKAAKENAEAENEKLSADGDLEEKRVEAMNVQRDAVGEQLEQSQAEIDRITLQIEKLQTLNAAYVAKIAEYHAMAVEAIERQAEAPAQAEDEQPE